MPDPWAGVWGVRHQILSRLSRYFNVLWVPPNRGWREAWLGAAEGGDAIGSDVSRPNFSIFAHSRWLPEIYRPRFLAKFLRRRMMKKIIRKASAMGGNRIVLYVWRPQFGYTLDGIGHDVSLYHIDDEYSFSETEVPLSDEEADLMERVDHVFIHSAGLMEKKGRIGKHTLCVPNGVDSQAFATPVPEPDDLSGIKRPRIAYVGVIKKQLDLEMMRDVARRKTDWSFVLVGPVGNVEGKAHFIEEMATYGNVHMLGPKAASELPAYVQHVDVCTMCYEMNAYTQCIYPLKLHEYLAAGKPVVSTPIKTVLEFDAVVDYASTTDEWCDVIARNLAPDANSDTLRDARQSTAREYDWNNSVTAVATTITEHLGR